MQSGTTEFRVVDSEQTKRSSSLHGAKSVIIMGFTDGQPWT